MYYSNYYERGILNVLRGIPLTAPTSLLLRLYITPTDDDNAGTELSYPGYTPQTIIFTPPTSESGGIGFWNSEEIKFAKSTISAGTVTHIAIHDSPSGGNRWLWGRLIDEIPVNVGVAPTLRVGKVKFWSTGNFSNAFRVAILNVARGITLQGMNSHMTLFNGNPESGGSELSGGNYKREPTEFSAPVDNTSGALIILNTNNIETAEATISLGSYNYDVLYSDVANGIPVWYKESTPSSYGKGDAIQYDAGSIQVGVN